MSEYRVSKIIQVQNEELELFVASLGQKIMALEENICQFKNNLEENICQFENKLNLVNNKLNLVNNELQSIRLDLESNYVSKTLFKESNKSKVSCKSWICWYYC